MGCKLWHIPCRISPHLGIFRPHRGRPKYATLCVVALNTCKVAATYLQYACDLLRGGEPVGFCNFHRLPCPVYPAQLRRPGVGAVGCRGSKVGSGGGRGGRLEVLGGWRLAGSGLAVGWSGVGDFFARGKCYNPIVPSKFFPTFL